MIVRHRINNRGQLAISLINRSSLRKVAGECRPHYKGYSAPLKLKENIALNCPINRGMIVCLVLLSAFKKFRRSLVFGIFNHSSWLQLIAVAFCSNCISETCDVFQDKQ